MSLLGAVVQGVSSVAGGLLGSRANERAAETASDATLEGARLQAEANERAAEIAAEQAELARQEFRASAQRGIQAIRAGQGEFDARMAQMPTREITGPNELTPGQRIAMEDTRRGAQEMLAASGLRGAGRAVTAAINDVEGRQRARFYDVNQARTDDELQRRQRLQELGARNAQAVGGDIANTEIGAGTRSGQTFRDLGSQQSRLQTATGQAQGAASQQAGAIQANAGTANANLWGQTIGNISSIVADELSQQRKRDVAGRNVRTGV